MIPAAAAAVDAPREPAAAVERAEEERVRVHDDVRVHLVDQVRHGLVELEMRAVVDEPELGVRRDVVHDLGHELAVARGVAVVVAPRQAVGRVEAAAMLQGQRGQLRAGQVVEPRDEAEGLVEHGDLDAGAAQARGMQRRRTDARRAERCDGVVGRGDRRRVDALDGRARAQRRHGVRRHERLHEPAAGQLHLSPGRLDGVARRRDGAGRLNEHEPWRLRCGRRRSERRERRERDHARAAVPSTPCHAGRLAKVCEAIRTRIGRSCCAAPASAPRRARAGRAAARACSGRGRRATRRRAARPRAPGRR